MAGLQVPIDEVVRFDAICSSSTGAAANATGNVTFSIFEEDDAAPMAAYTDTVMTQRGALTGNYYGSITASGANGFEAGKFYNVIGTATVGGVVGKAVLLTFRCVPAESVVGVPKVDQSVLSGTALTETGGGYLAGSFKKFFDKQTPTGTINSLPDAVAGAADGLVIGSAAYKLAVDLAGKVAVPDGQKVDVNTIKTKGVTVDAGGTTFPSSIHASGAAVAKSPATLAAGDIANDAITAAAIANGAIDNATFAADVGSTAYAMNIIALAVRMVLDELNLDHLAKTATAAADMTTEVPDGTILSRILSATADTSTYLGATDSLEAIRDRGDLAWATGSGAAADLAYAPSGAPTITTKHADAVGGAYTDLATVDGALFSIREAATTNPPLDFYFPFTAAAGVFPASLRVWGYYSGNSTHWIRVQAAVGGVTTVWEDIGTIPNGTAVTAYSFPLTPQHINAGTGAAYIRFLHNGVAGVASHYLYLDKLLFTAQSVVAADTPGTTTLLTRVPQAITMGQIGGAGVWYALTPDLEQV